jgi:aspartyl-tRNA(Asn)/glutamyl-tRNA(Gln) amidotransferase subunit A
VESLGPDDGAHTRRVEQRVRGCGCCGFGTLGDWHRYRRLGAVAGLLVRAQGLKTTIGRVSTYGILPLSPTLDTPGPLARSVDDAALLYSVMQGPDPFDPRTRGITPSDPVPMLRRGVQGLRLARMPETEREGVDGEVLAAYDAALESLARLGAKIVTTDLPCRFADYTGLTARIIGAEGYFLLADLIDDMSLPIDEAVRPRIAAGRGISARDYLAALRDREQAKRQFAEATADIDALLTPTTQMAAIPLDAVDQTTTPAHFTRFVNFLDLCAVALPNGFTASGLPISLQIVCRGYDEATALRIGWAYQQASDWHERWPPDIA